MIAEDDALQRILASLAPLDSETLPLLRAAGRRAAQAVWAPASLPRFDQSAMDGYAVRTEDTPGKLRIVGEQPAGASRALRVGAGEAVRIFTGAILPDGADAVVMQEDASASDGAVEIPEPAARGEFIRRAGEDLCEGQKILDSGDLLTPARIGLLAAAGISQAPVHRRPRLAILTTGDEIRPAGSTLRPGEIFDSNGLMLHTLLARDAEICAVAHVGDRPAEVQTAIQSLPPCEALVISGGVSVGDHDPVRSALSALGAHVEFWQVAIKPGKPFLFGSWEGRSIFGLPGNPVSSFVTALLFVRPALVRQGGGRVADCRPRFLPAPLAAAIDNPGPRPHYIRARLEDGVASPCDFQQSHGLHSLAQANALLRINAGVALAAGDMAPSLLID